MPPSPAVPSEIQAQIVAILSDRTQDLRACALSASSLRYAAQPHLFNDITINHPRNATDNPLSAEEDEIFACAAFTRLAEVLAANQDLKKHIRSASFIAYLGVVTILANLDLPRLRQLRIYSDASGAINGPLIDPLRRLIGLESMRHVKICADFSAHIFSACTRHLTKLAFESAEEDSGEDMATLAPDAQRPWVTHLCLDNSRFTTDWLIDSQCPFDFTHLVEFSIHMSISNGVIHLLRLARQTLSTLSLTLADLQPAQLEILDMAYFPALTHINLVVPSVCNIVGILPALSDLDRVNLIRTITFRVEDFCGHATADIEAQLNSFDTILAKLPLPALKAIVVVLPEPQDPGVYTATEATLRRAMPVLERRQTLIIEREND
ncbi:hypothetical protein FB451DRAFT_66640 [Mycena latifolia]|nr:hypothetical protein FB451DRAFT_66640 [Mycena latifolia]